ncbi:MAG TPA: DPP IV N-terminal domain-containing protein [Gemmatimonadota bacterium]|nr:DPP IV N-terminal domain-containing protein [Gemmatimonadota bacterium]
MRLERPSARFPNRLPVLLLLGALAVPAAAVAQQPARQRQEKETFSSIREALSSQGILSGSNGPSDVNWIDGGKRFSYTTRSGGGEEIRAYDPATGKDTLLFTAKGRTFPGTDSAFSYRSFQWASDSRHLVFRTRFEPIYRRSGTADFYVYSLDDGSMTLAARGARTAELSPGGSMLGFERGGDMYVYDMSAGKETRLTRDARENVFDGHFDWVYEEEFGMAQAWNWSPDSRHIAYWQVDQSAEPVVQLTDYQGRHPDWTRIRIPQPGDSNAVVKIGVVDVRSGKNVWLDTGFEEEHYIPRIYWTSRPDTLAVVTLDRPQQTMKLFFFDVTTGGRRLVHTWTSDTWIDVYDFYAGIQDMLTFPAGMDQFFWISDRDGWQHVYRYDYSGKLVNQVTSGEWSVTRVEGIDRDSRTVYYTSTQASPLQRQLYAVSFDGSHTRRLTKTGGTHHIDMSPDTRWYIDRWSDLDTPRQVELWATGRKQLKTMEDNAPTSRWLETHAYSRPVLFHFTTSDSVRLDASMVRPIPFDSTRRYPVILAIYGGPGSQQVYDTFDASTWTQWLAQQGYIVVGVNNRGSNNYGSRFMKAVYGQLGKWESHDFAETARHMARLPYVDPSRIGITGTSYGGYSTVYTMEMYPGLFPVGIANSAVTDWKLYDTIYTERYMGLLGANRDGYRASSAVDHAGSMEGHLLLIHSMMDDNVHPRNTMQLLTALADDGKDVDLRIYPPGRHGAAYDMASYLLMRQVEFDYLQRELGGGPEGSGR